MLERTNQRLAVLAVAGLFSIAVIGGPAGAVGTDDPLGGSRFGTASVPSAGAKKPAGIKAATTAKKKAKKAKRVKRSEQQFLDGYRAARALVLDGKYDAAIGAFRALDNDGHPDVANYIGFASRKLGRYDDAKLWYEKALAADPDHVRTWQYYGMWHVEQGNMLKAHDHLEKIQLICGTSCQEFKDLRDAMDGKISY